MRAVPQFVLLLLGVSAALPAHNPLDGRGTRTAVVTRSPSAAAFERLKLLVGQWKGSFGGTDITLTYTQTANGSALMEVSQSDEVMITMFTVDGDHLIATHYCSAQNQPQLRTAAITDAQAPQIVFALERVTGMKTPDDWHNTGLVMILTDNDHLTQEWTYRMKGKDGKNVFHFARVRAGADSSQGRPSSNQAPAPRDAMIRTLAAASPHPSMGDEARTFDRLAGTWDCAYTFYLDDGTVKHKSGELSFGWILDGRALQDVWITYPTNAQQERTISTSIRFFDTALKQWRVVFVSPKVNYSVSVQGGMEGDRIVLHGTDVDGLPIRWSFNDIKQDSFTWRGEKSHDGGRTWKLEEEHHMQRRVGAGGVG